MSRFGLRSNADGYKLSDEKAKRHNLCKSAKVTLKRVYQQNAKFPLLNDESESKSDMVDEGTTDISIVCSLPLNRISSIIEKLNLTNSESNIKSTYNEKTAGKHDRGEFSGNDKEKREPRCQHQEAAVIKIMCLYCDKKFTSHKMQSKHVEKFHTQQKDRRCSGRNSQMHHESQKSCGSSSTASPVLNFPGCKFCKKSRVQQMTAPAKDLKSLFLHFTEYHADKYFGCKTCVLRFQNSGKLSKHMQVIHKLPFDYEESIKCKENDVELMPAIAETKDSSKLLKTRLQKSSKTSNSSSTTTVSQCVTPINHNMIIGAEEPILSRLGLTQNRLPNNRKGVRLRREAIIPDMLLKSEQTTTFSPPSKLRTKATKSAVIGIGIGGSPESDVVFRMPTRTESVSCVFDDGFYKEVISNVRINLLYYLDGKISGNTINVASKTAVMKHSLPHIRSALLKDAPVADEVIDSEIHAATCLSTTTAFPTLLTAEQYGADTGVSKIRRPHTKHSWKWKWDSVKKYKLINEGGKIVKKMKQPAHGLRDLSKLDMWTQLTMRQKFEQQRATSVWQQNERPSDLIREEKQLLTDQLNFILDMRILPHIILEQNEQTLIKFENDENCNTPLNVESTRMDNNVQHSCDDETFLSLLHLLPYEKKYISHPRLILSGEWARPRCYLCMCCGAKFEKLKSLEEHKMFRHSHILSMHYEVVGRELLAGNLLRHLFLPKRALGRYGKESSFFTSQSHMLALSKNDSVVDNRINITVEYESSDSIQSVLNSSTTHTYSAKNSTTDDCDTDTKTTLDINTVSPSHSLQSSILSNRTGGKMQTKKKELSVAVPSCTKCKRKCNGVLDLYRHMLDCSGDYIWSLAKKRKYRYYCGSKKRRPYNKHNYTDLRRSKQKNIKAQSTLNTGDETNANYSKTKSSPRQRPSDAESIKKMLENLPPKRVCKKIFPTVTKAKKSKNTKFITKHKMYNTQVLRKTRTRQMSQNKKLLTKTKSQFAIKAANKKVFKRRIKNARTMENKALILSSATSNKLSSTVLENDHDDDVRKTPRTAIFNQTQKQCQPLEVKQSPANVEAEKTSNDTSIETPVTNLSPADVKITPIVENSIVSTGNICDNLRSSKSEQRINPQATSTPSISSDINSKSATQLLENCNYNKKRVKRINDCIAMLTGKLEEKLKTEQKVASNQEVAVEAECEAASKKVQRTPKRKTISRRIIKPDTLELALPAPPQQVELKPNGPNLIKEPILLPLRTEPVLPIPINLDRNPKIPLFLPVNKLNNAAPHPPLLPLPIAVESIQRNIVHSLTILQPSPLLPQPTEPVFNIEPLNLSNFKSFQKQNVTPDLESKPNRSSIPARRQTICGFEARGFMGFDETEPLDLSKKTHNELPPVTKMPLMPALTSTSTVKGNTHLISPIPSAAPAEIILGKQFYSNLDLLRIPQVRNPGCVPTNEVISPNFKNITKKRNNIKISTELSTKPTPVNNQAKCHTKELPMHHKKENSGKSKPLQKMDEVVNNHIDDAINSVINAVKASLPDNDIVEPISTHKNLVEKVHPPVTEGPEKPVKIPIPEVPIEKEEIKPIKHVTAHKRCMRSKTLDCRPASLVPNVISKGVPNAELPCITRSTKKVATKSEIKGQIIPNPQTLSAPLCDAEPASISSTPTDSTKTIEDDKTSCVVDNLQIEDNNEVIKPAAISIESEVAGEIVQNASVPIPNNNIPLAIANDPHNNIPLAIANDPHNNIPLAIATETLEKCPSEETTVNINNAPIASQSSALPEIFTDCKKKQRRRRKNELAAIVADQLLESFKIDKARRDNLKKLEYLAYEKSDDLLLTGMLLMSSTKRNASSAFSSTQNTSDKNGDKNTDGTKRQKQEQMKNVKNKIKNVPSENTGEQIDATTAQKDNPDKETVLEKEKVPDFKKGKRRQYRRRGKALDNENISKLKSSLESFSIGIEKQLCEIEAKNANVFNVAEAKMSNIIVSAPAKPSSILRPSILSAAREPSKPNKGTSSESITVVSSRDPRVNKNIHKEDKELDHEGDCGAKHTTNPECRFQFDDEKKLETICDFEEDNYLTEIAKNVNEKIMSAENEEFVFANDGFDMVNELQDDSNSKYYRPPTSMSVRSAPNLNDDHSNFGSMCDENTNTEVMDMDLDDELSVYTSYSQDTGRGRRKRRRRRSILLKRKPKKRPGCNLTSEKFDCELCKKTFFTANSLAKHTMTLAHVSKVSEQEYLLSQSINCVTDANKSPIETSTSQFKLGKDKRQIKSLSETHSNESPYAIQKDISRNNTFVSKTTQNVKDKNDVDSTSGLTLNPDERLFFECCNILKSAETPRISSGNRSNTTNFTYTDNDKTLVSSATVTSVNSSKKISVPERLHCKTTIQKEFRDPQMLPASFSKPSAMNINNELHRLSPNYSAISQFSAVTNTTSRFKTKAAMKGYENTLPYLELTIPQDLENKSRSVCKLTELADIALENEKPNTAELIDLSSNHCEDSSQNTPEFVTSTAIGNRKDCILHINREHNKNNDSQSSTSSKTIMHSSIIKAAVEEHNKVPSGKIIIPDRPFKNIGLEEKETITFQKPKTTINLLNDDNSVSTASYSDRDDFEFGSITCDDDNSIKTSNEKIVKNDSSESSSSRATAKTFENKSLIMGRIFKNAGSTKTMSAIKLKTVTVPKDQTVKADLNQIFDELRGDCGKTKSFEESLRKEYSAVLTEDKHCVTVNNPVTTCTNKAIRKKSNSGRKKQKDISKLQSELGMSPEEIEKLIVEGRRKSKRRCATNRPKKLVEMWSSDEYEEFLSTKDIIALIEEKEKQEKRRKRKHSVSLSSSHIENKDKELNSLYMPESKRKHTKSCNAVEKTENHNNEFKNVEISVKKINCGVTKQSERRDIFDENKDEKDIQNSFALSISKNSIGKINNKSTSITKSKKTNTAAPKTKCDHVGTLKSVTTENGARRGSKVKKSSSLEEIYSKKAEVKDGFSLSELKRNNNYRTRNKEKAYDAPKKDVNKLKAFSKESCSTKVSKKCNNRRYKGKRKTQANQSLPRRKRLASEKLYYWSSSSDEEFGRINTSHVQDFESGEQYRKHGWIVGDSHKKLVTLLAIAKGNKRVENCGVKKNIPKKKS